MLDGIYFETLNSRDKTTVSSVDEMDVVFSALIQTTTTCSVPSDIVGHFAQPKTGSEKLPKTPILCKPSEDAMEQALRIANVDPQRTMFFDDSVRNIQSGKRVGLHTVLVGNS